MQTYAANNHIFISAANTCRPYSLHSSFFVHPDGLITSRLPLHRPGLLIDTINTNARFTDPSEHWRHRAIRGILHSGTLVRYKRSDCPTAL